MGDPPCLHRAPQSRPPPLCRGDRDVPRRLQSVYPGRAGGLVDCRVAVIGEEGGRCQAEVRNSLVGCPDSWVHAAPAGATGGVWGAAPPVPSQSGGDPGTVLPPPPWCCPPPMVLLCPAGAPQALWVMAAGAKNRLGKPVMPVPPRTSPQLCPGVLRPGWEWGPAAPAPWGVGGTNLGNGVGSGAGAIWAAPPPGRTP